MGLIGSVLAFKPSDIWLGSWIAGNFLVGPLLIIVPDETVLRLIGCSKVTFQTFWSLSFFKVDFERNPTQPTPFTMKLVSFPGFFFYLSSIG